MRTILVIGIGTGNPAHVTIEAIAAMNRADVFFVVDKGPAAGELNRIREEILARFVTRAHRIVAIADPPRDRTAAAYEGAVADWHAARAGLYGEAIVDALGADGCGAFLVWGDPSLYDSTLRILDGVERAGVTFARKVIPGIASPQALAAAHGIVLNGVGEPVRITTGRRLATEPPGEGESVVVMLDDGTGLDAVADDAEVWWGAYLGTPDEVILAGRLGDIRHAIKGLRAERRARKGWIMDICLLRHRRGAPPA
ncbi:MAG: precorrin-6A synthase (deacetylating) [Rhizobiales bacterium]|nr:precorrin-6A synthase (deacetylating) [Hyphomicrobiales bacterium]